MRFTLFIFISLFAGVAGFSQEKLTGLHINPMVRARAIEYNQMKYLANGEDTLPVAMPFFDDFSANSVFPSSKRWIDRFAFENDDFPVFPINQGAMTLDAINDSGNMYPTAVPGPMSFIADHLTSRYIRLDSAFTPVPHALTPADSVYLSFFFQPQGRGMAPQKIDTLLLEFLTIPAHDSIIPGDTIKIPDAWKQKWYALGMSLDTFRYYNNNKYFIQVMVPVTDPVFFTNKFRFRFTNYVSLASSAEPSWQNNTAQWNLDNVYLNTGRNRYDTVYPELRFVYRPPSLLRRYASMPYPQYCNDPTNEVKDTLEITMTNRDIIPQMSTYSYYVTNPATSFSKTYNGGSYNIDPYKSVPYVTYQKFAHPEVPFLIPISQADSAIFLMKHVLRATTPGTVMGDTMQAYQKFFNYYAYDDGTPEASYGLSPTGSQLAYGFNLNKSPDTLRAVSMFFNRTLGNDSKQFFYLCVWNDNAGKPGDTIYSDLVMPRYADSLNKFATYHIYPPLAITGKFYVGWIQTTDDNLSIGFDRQNRSQNEIFYNTTGVWNNSSFEGSLMIRPIIGKPIPLGIGDIPANDVKISVYPNPCNSGLLHLCVPDSYDKTSNYGDGTILISDLVGHILLKTGFQQEINVTSLSNGLYFLEIRNRAGVRVGTAKFIIT
ncbi:MAG: T9SS type A sorting domain-containing protein [Bacteroidetes bacterium]|nr:T9SS type A sorting domain-containing protein [Bacteroidota bacterium]